MADVAAKLRGDAFGDAGRTVVIEEGLTGPELSFLAVTDGTAAAVLPFARDHKRIGDGDTGPNTGGMGAYSPVAVPDGMVDDVLDRFVGPTLRALRGRGIDYRGVLYGGLMLTPEGPKMLEYNVRFGDPEAQAVVPRITGDLAEWLASAAAGRLGPAPAITGDAAVTVVCAAPGYPVAPRLGDPIGGIEEAAALPATSVFCAGVGPGMVTAGGRVLAVTALGADVAEARARAYAGVERISFPGMQVRRDIAADAVGAVR
jgi:phosphoribosylamine--glycine ligase